ncbi:MAG: low temperature requirement protein A [Sporichthyaceae bacterium]|nr:low temperature requirement protein A [Sporichthyaceae bacterium]
MVRIRRPGVGANPDWYRPMRARDGAEQHRSATPLELLFDLCFVVAVALAADELHHELSEGQLEYGRYLMVFFAIWWAWMNVTWFASAYDTDDVPYRLAMFAEIAGVLILAAGVPRAFQDADFAVVTLGYAVMRVALAAQWLRAGLGHPAGRTTALRFAAGVTVCMIGWALLLLVPVERRVPWLLLMIVAELLVPLWAERAGRTSWHPEHIAERYGLFTLIVLGETVFAATLAVQAALDTGGATRALLISAGAGLVVVFGMWWVYFDQPAARFLVSNREGFLWGYGHFVIFASAAAMGAGLLVKVDHITGTAHISPAAAGAAVAVPAAVFLFAVWFLQVRPHHRGSAQNWAFLAAVGLALAAPLAGPATLPALALVLAALVAVCVLTTGAPHQPAAG